MTYINVIMSIERPITRLISIHAILIYKVISMYICTLT